MLELHVDLELAFSVLNWEAPSISILNFVCLDCAVVRCLVVPLNFFIVLYLLLLGFVYGLSLSIFVSY